MEQEISKKCITESKTLMYALRQGEGVENAAVEHKLSWLAIQRCEI